MKMAQDGFPAAEPPARGLGIREPGQEGVKADIDVDSDGLVVLNERGMSVARGWRDLPPHRIPRRMDDGEIGARGPDKDCVWCLGQGEFLPGPVSRALLLAIKIHNTSSGNVVPAQRVTVAQFLMDLAATRKDWSVDEA